MSLSTIAIPVFLDTDTESAHLIRHWARLYRYGGLYMPGLSVAATGLYGYAALRKRASNRKKQWSTYAAAGAATIAMVPFTLLVMAPTNNTLLRLEALTSTEPAPMVVGLSTVQGLVVRWAWLHAVRSVFPLVGAILGLVGVLQELGL